MLTSPSSSCDGISEAADVSVVIRESKIPSDSARIAGKCRKTGAEQGLWHHRIHTEQGYETDSSDSESDGTDWARNMGSDLENNREIYLDASSPGSPNNHSTGSQEDRYTTAQEEATDGSLRRPGLSSSYSGVDQLCVSFERLAIA
ncbi:hypothetical protein AAF712_006580 [Marasmius tenuissimus]|uniref:Uncharacterized protein n=1 Tax=Marasmius tenuissimus TaxID=585030 RepID=A0ABR2ZZ49_9AGAR